MLSRSASLTLLHIRDFDYVKCKGKFSVPIGADVFSWGVPVKQLVEEKTLSNLNKALCKCCNVAGHRHRLVKNGCEKKGVFLTHFFAAFDIMKLCS